MHTYAISIPRLIDVTAPYFSLQNLVIINDTIRAEIPIEHPMGSEQGVIAAAEVGRHLAILGSCALAYTNPVKKKHFYIASDAALKNLQKDILDATMPLVAEATTISLAKRKGSAIAKIVDSNDRPLYELQTNYHIMKPILFGKLYQSRENIDSVEAALTNPYLDSFPLSNVTYREKTLSAVLGPIKPHTCAGHFNGYPCIPVAILMHALSNAAGLLLGHALDRPKIPYSVLSADVIADQFAFAGESVFIEIQQEESNSDSDTFAFRCSAFDDESNRFGYMDLCLRVNL